MRLAEYWHEASHNIGLKHQMVALVTALAIGTTTYQLVGSGQDALELTHQRVLQGATTWQVRANRPEQPLSAAACDAIGRVSGVRAGGARSADSGLATFPEGHSVAVMDITPGLVSVWTGTNSNAPVMAGRELVASGVVEPGQQLYSAGKAVATVGGVLPEEVSDVVLATSILRVTVPQDTVDRCWIRIPSDGSVDVGPLAQWAFGDTPVRTTPLLPPLPPETRPFAAWQRVTAVSSWAPLTLPVALICCLALMTRRRGFAIYRTFGMGRAALTLLVMLEHLLVLLPAASVGWVLGVCATAATQQAPLDPRLLRGAAHIGCSQLLVLLTTCLIATALSQGGNQFRQLKE